MNTKYNDVELAAAREAHVGVPTVDLSFDFVRKMAKGGVGEPAWRGIAARQLLRDLEHNNSGWCAVTVTKESFDVGVDLGAYRGFVVVDVEI